MRGLPVSMAGRLRNYQKAHFPVSHIQRLVRFAWRNLQSITGRKQMPLTRKFHRQLAREHVKELSRTHMKMPLLFCARRHALFNHAEIRIAQQMPAVADISPRIVISFSQLEPAHSSALVPYSGIFPCFFGGFLSRLPSSISSAAISRRRVSWGAITASTYPRSAAIYGFANCSRNS